MVLRGRLEILADCEEIDLCGAQSLDALSARYLSDDLPRLVASYQHRIAKAERRWPLVNGWRGRNRFIAEKLAKARFDVERTDRVFRAYKRPQGR